MFLGILPEPFNSAIATLLYRVCTCHALAKLRMHTDASVDHLQRSIAAFASELRKAEKCLRNIQQVGTRKSKTSYRIGQSNIKGKRKHNSSHATVTGPDKTLTNPPPSLNRNTVKLHSIGDYPRSILRYGSVDSYSTFLVNLLPHIPRVIILTLFNRANLNIKK